MRVLLLAEQCNPTHTSSPLKAYKYCAAIANAAEDVWVATALRNKSAIDQLGIGRAKPIYIDNEQSTKTSMKWRRFLRAGADLGALLSLRRFSLFERDVYRSLEAELRAGQFDIVNRITPTSSAIPSVFQNFVNVPFVLGPVNGGLTYPRHFRWTQIRELEILRFLRSIHTATPSYKRSIRSCSAILAGFSHTVNTLPKDCRDRIFEMPDMGADSRDFVYKQRIQRVKCRFVFVGRLIPFKCPTVAVHAFAQSKLLHQHEIVFVGDGPERSSIESVINKYGLHGSVTLMGNVAHTKVAQIMQDSDVFVFPSIRDAGAAVLAEAMMSGMPSITVNYGPPESLLTDACGIRVPLGSFEDHVQSFRAAMEKLSVNPELRASMGHASHQRASRILDWDVKAKRIVQVYEWVLGRRKDKPDFYSEEPV
jgi:glycosyltransferase involved in cell wall biosynthesis